MLEPGKDYGEFLGFIDIAIRSIQEEAGVAGAQQGNSLSPSMST